MFAIPTYCRCRGGGHLKNIVMPSRARFHACKITADGHAQQIEKAQLSAGFLKLTWIRTVAYVPGVDGDMYSSRFSRRSRFISTVLRGNSCAQGSRVSPLSNTRRLSRCVLCSGEIKLAIGFPEGYEILFCAGRTSLLGTRRSRRTYRGNFPEGTPNFLLPCLSLPHVCFDVNTHQGAAVTASHVSTFWCELGET